MEIDIYWQAIRWLAVEHLHLSVGDEHIRADGMIIGAFDDRPLRIRTDLLSDSEWQTTSVRVQNLVTASELVLERSDDGQWSEPDRRSRDDLGDAVDVDIAATPFTNTLPINRLALDNGDSAEISVVYISVSADLTARPMRQRYTRLEDDEGHQRYLYESLESDFRRELLVDAQGLVIDYPGIWRRALPLPSRDRTPAPGAPARPSTGPKPTTPPSR